MFGPTETAAQEATVITQSAMNLAPASAAKLTLIREFMRVTGLQTRLDSGSQLERYAYIPELGWSGSDGQFALLDIFAKRLAALQTAYAHYRPIFQEQYEGHINWEYTEQELRQMVEFFSSPVGQHYLDGSWRTDAYAGTNLEDVEQALVEEAIAAHREGGSEGQP